MSIFVTEFPKIFSILMFDNYKYQESHFKQSDHPPDLTPKPPPSGQILFTARCADDSESIGITTIGIVSVAWSDSYRPHFGPCY